MELEEIQKAVAGVPIISPAQGRELYEHVRTEQPQEILELGTFRGASAAYMGAALEANGSGRLTTVDHASAAALKADELIESVGLSHRVDVVRAEHASYVWWLRDQVALASDAAGNVAPRFGFCYLDGAHNFTIDGMAAVLVEKLLLPGAWLLLDDLGWTYEHGSEYSQQSDGVSHPMSAAELREPHIRSVFDLIVRQHPAFTQFREKDDWGWAQKKPGAPREYRLETSEPLGRVALRQARRIRDGLRRQVRGAAPRSHDA